MRAEVTFLSRVIFGVDEDRIVRTSRHAGFAADADRFIEIDDAVSALEHRRRRTRGDARRVRALITARDLMRPASLRKHADIDMLDVRSRHANRDHVFRLAGGRARVTADTAGVIDYLGPLHLISAVTLLLNHATECRAI